MGNHWDRERDVIKKLKKKRSREEWKKGLKILKMAEDLPRTFRFNFYGLRQLLASTNEANT